MTGQSTCFFRIGVSVKYIVSEYISLLTGFAYSGRKEMFV
jgi:hypothetical protein